MKKAFNIAATKAIRTFAQAEAGGLSALTVVSLARPDMMVFGNALILATAASVLAAIITFLQNFAEAIPE